MRWETAGQPVPILPAEAQLLNERAVPRRRLHFTLGRAAAHDALDDLGAPTAIVGRAPGGEPIWPDGIVGSITHAGNVAAAVVASASHLAGLGLDLELTRPGLSAAAAHYVCHPRELAWAEAAGPRVADQRQAGDDVR